MENIDDMTRPELATSLASMTRLCEGQRRKIATLQRERARLRRQVEELGGRLDAELEARRDASEVIRHLSTQCERYKAKLARLEMRKKSHAV